MTKLCITTALGGFEIDLQEQQAPQTSAYFRSLVEQGLMQDAQAFRLLSARNQNAEQHSPIHVVQFGRESWMATHKHQVPHEHTRLSGLSHQRWCVSAARFGKSELYGSFFVCMEDEPALDYGGDRHDDGEGFAVFGQVCSGYDVLEAIYAAPISGERLDPPIAISNVSLIRQQSDPIN